MNILLFIILFIIILLIIYFLFLQKNLQTEKFKSCNNVTKVSTTGISSICTPYYGIAPANAINPYTNSTNNSSIYEANNADRLAKNKDSIQKLCAADPFCNGFFINEKTDSTNEGYLCKHGWNKTQTLRVDNPSFHFQTYKCDDPTNSHLNLSEQEIIIMNANVISYKKKFNSKIANKYLNYNFNDESVIKYPATASSMANQPIVYNLGNSNDDNLVELFNFANTMDTCIGFTIFKQADNTYNAKFYEKIKDIELKLIKNNNTISYVSVITDKKKLANQTRSIPNCIHMSHHEGHHEAELHKHNARVNLPLYNRHQPFVMLCYTPGSINKYGFIAWGQGNENNLAYYKFGSGNEPRIDPARDNISVWIYTHGGAFPNKLKYILLKEQTRTITEQILVDA